MKKRGGYDRFQDEQDAMDKIMFEEEEFGLSKANLLILVIPKQNIYRSY